MAIDDDVRWLVALISDTGMRLSEAAGLHINDIMLDNDIPYIDLKPHSWRGLKTKGSQSQIPLNTNFGIGLALVRDIILPGRSFDITHNPPQTGDHHRVVSYYVVEVVVVTLGYTYSATPSFRGKKDTTTTAKNLTNFFVWIIEILTQ